MAKEFADYDTDGKVINRNIVNIGTLNTVIISPKEVF